MGRHIDAICKDAGLNAMVDVLEIVLDRDVLDGGVVLLLGPSDVRTLYDQHLEPAIDEVESALFDWARGREF